MVLSKQLQALQAQEKANTPNSERPVLYNWARENKSKCYYWNHGRTHSLDHTSAAYLYPKTGHQVGATLGGNMGGNEKWYKEDKAHE